MRRQAVRILRFSFGGVLLVIGVIGGFIPILQGWMFIVAGLTVMAPESTLAQQALDWAKQKIGRGGDEPTSDSEADQPKWGSRRRAKRRSGGRRRRNAL